MRIPSTQFGGPRGLLLFAVTLAIGTAGGWLFRQWELPLPWMLGSMTAVTLAVLLRLPMAAPPGVRPPMVAVIGVMLGAAFHPALVSQLPGWLPTMAGLVAFSAVTGAACWFYLMRVAGFDRTTAYFAGMPGGLVEMIEVGGRHGGDEVTIALTHAARILMVVFSVPFLLEFTQGVEIGGRPASAIGIADAPWTSFLELAFCAVAGSWIGGLLRLPAQHLMGPMLVSAVLHATGLTTFVPPAEIVQGAQVVLGAVLGCRFRAAAPMQVLRILAIAAGMTVVLLGFTVLFASLVAGLTGIGAMELILAYSPGGLAEMSLVALAIQADVAFIAAHHLARVLLVMVGAAPAFALANRLGAARRRRP